MGYIAVNPSLGQKHRWHIAVGAEHTMNSNEMLLILKKSAEEGLVKCFLASSRPSWLCLTTWPVVF